jgi:hypothetical protein
LFPEKKDFFTSKTIKPGTAITHAYYYPQSLHEREREKNVIRYFKSFGVAFSIEI